MTEAIDVFCHCLPPRLNAAVDAALAAPLPMLDRARSLTPMVDLEARLRLMEQFPGYRQILSLASPALEAIVGPERSPELARIGNDVQAEWCTAHPDQFPGFIASLPMNHPEAALAEAARAVEELGAVGVQVYTHVNGQPLDAPEHRPLFKLMANLDRPIWLHPLRGAHVPDYPNEPMSRYDIWWAFGWPHESSVAMARLVFAGVFDEWPDLKIITHHAGGTVPMMEGRLQAGLDLFSDRYPPAEPEAVRPVLSEPAVEAFRRFYADTATFGSRTAIECGRSFFGNDRMLFATDMPFDPELGAANIRETLRAIEVMEISEKDRAAILHGNARRLMNLNS